MTVERLSDPPQYKMKRLHLYQLTPFRRVHDHLRHPCRRFDEDVDGL